MKKNLKTKILTALIALGVVAGSYYTPSDIASAATRAEISQISINSSGSNFKYWNKDAVALKQLTDFVKDVTDKNSRNFIPVEDRIAVFDMDGTIIGETTPYYFEWMLYLDRIYNDPSYQATKELKNNAELVRAAVAERNVTKEIAMSVGPNQITSLAGLNKAQFRKVVEHAMNQPVPGLTNIKYGELVYLPMVEVLSYLQANDFTIYIVSGGIRQIVRCYAEGVLPIAPNHIIGKDCVLKAANQGDIAPDDYIFNRDTDEIVTTGTLLERNDGEAKAAKIEREIGMKPVLSFGNSTGDASMHEYTQSNRKYKHISFEILCDDVTREYGNPDKADKIKTMSEKYGWITVSMQRDWNTIYGDNIHKCLQ